MEDVVYVGSGRSIDIELGGQEVITIDLDNLDPNPEDVLDLLKEGQCRVSVWTKLGWRIQQLHANGTTASSPPIYALLANIQIAHAQKAPKLVLSEAREDKLTNVRPKEEYYQASCSSISTTGERAAAEGGEGVGGTLAFLTRGTALGYKQLATRSMDDAMRSFEGVLAEKPTNVVALLGKARILYARRSYPQALKLFQQILQLNPRCIPDPRIGIGLCLWAMDYKSKAKAAWQRSLEVNPTDWPAQLLLGLESINASKTENLSEKERAQAFLAGTKFIEKAFNANQKSAAAANALCELFLRKNSYKRALKLAERTIQFADTLTLLTEGNLRAARVLHAEGSLKEATKYYTTGLQMANQNTKNEIAAAIHTLDLLLQPPNPQRSVEAMVMLASLRAHPRPGVSSSDFAQEKAKARELFDRAIKALEQDDSRTANGHVPQHTASYINDDLDMHIDPRLLNNMGALQHMEGNLAESRALYEDSLTKAASLGPDVGEGMSTSMLYNLARVYEDAYDKLLARHPEYVDAKVRQAQMLADLNQSNEAHDLLKQAMASQNNNLNLRAFYTYFLIQSNLPKPAKDFVFATLKDHDKHDVYSLCAAGWIQYHQSRESRDPSPKGLEERRTWFPALCRIPLCAFAAQGLAIVTAEDALGSFGGGPSTSGGDDPQKRMRNARDALDIFAKIREVPQRRQRYETASVRFYSGHNVSVLLCLCRTWYAKASKDQSFVAMSTALKYAQKALHLQPSDKAILYNIAMVQQKSAELLFGLSPSKRTLKDLEWAILQAGHAQRLFASLAADSASVVPYSRDIADQRRKYGESMLRRGDEHLATQKEFEAEAQAKLVAARLRRQMERDKLKAIEQEKIEEHRRQAEKLAEERRKAREQAQEWTREVQMESEEERERKSKRAAKKVKVEGESGDEGAEPKKKKRSGGKLKKAIDQDVDNEQLFSDDEVDSKPAKKRVPKKRVVRDDDDQDAVGGPRKKQYKSKEIISDTDDEEMS
ncbi:hypothetical protein F4604DRAFT_1707232 [Suillus subluteus]|nr:hypothetical protein F4604DRAFT_1707232 [Suillus subluteus]